MPHRIDLAPTPGGQESTYNTRDITGYFPAAVTAGDIVAIDNNEATFGYLKSFKEAATTDLAWACGVALEDAAAGSFGQIRVRGLVMRVSIAASTSSGKRIIVSGTTAGQGRAIDGVTNFEQAQVIGTSVTGEGTLADGTTGVTGFCSLMLSDPFGLAA